eukprot:jgi/Tetstr1/420862/TSEL_011935.t1
MAAAAGKDEPLLAATKRMDAPKPRGEVRSPLRWPMEGFSVEMAQASALGSMWKLIDGEVATTRDLWRETHLRYLGYANELGEAFKHFLSPTVYRATYVIAGAYVLADSVDKGWRAWQTWQAEQAAKNDPLSNDYSQGGGAQDSKMPVLVAVADTLIWQSLASVMAPGLAINRAVWASDLLLGAAGPRMPAPLRRWGPTVVGLGLIPLIVHPIDEGVTWLMERTVRRWYADPDAKTHQQ